ncbi:hypothetical protein PRIPAC_72536 [Pristionchus pacificus]|uniref:Uncharacterized protein n=1 Tax=Pristionchus pacificus TaxID=54126 RepID=A0A8R1YC01_PRIPA|nr:hypothetical protein PRIPAC_72536 [Pristionchus pacificus]|eukprot:PDM80693.1 hypothetical protein PRIPAC_35696 [Pristionchus pacificus]
MSIDMKVLVFSSLLTVATTHFLGLPDPLNLFGPKCPKPEPCVCVCDKPVDHYVPPPPPPPKYEMPPPPPPVAYQEAPPPSYMPAPSYAPPPPPPDYQTGPTYRGVPPAPSMPVYNSGMDSMGPPGSSPAYIPEFKHRRKAAARH